MAKVGFDWMASVYQMNGRAEKRRIRAVIVLARRRNSDNLRRCNRDKKPEGTDDVGLAMKVLFPKRIALVYLRLKAPVNELLVSQLVAIGRALHALYRCAPGRPYGSEPCK